MSRSSVATFACIALFAASCAKYKEQIANQKDEIAKLRIDRAELEQNQADLEAQVEKLEADKNTLAGENSGLEAQIANLVEYQKALEEQIEKLGGDKEKMQQKFKAAQSDLESQQKLIEEMKRRQALAQARLDQLRTMLSKFKKLIEGGKLNVRVRNGKLMLELPSAILFPSGKAGLSDEGKATLAEVAGVLKDIRKREFQVAGHTDNVPINSPRFPSNWELSTARAVSVVKFLQDEGMQPKNLSAAGYSEYMPAASNDTQTGKAQNRRIEIVLMPNLDELPDLSSLEKEISN